jgi:dihydrolipoamide dehydrogenase
MRRAKKYGFKQVETIPDIAAIIARKQRVVRGLRGSIEQLFQGHGIDLFEGRGKLVEPGKIEVQRDGLTNPVEARNVVITTGSCPAGLPIFTSNPRIFLADEILDITYLPARLLVLGGGAVGVEMAGIFRELGSEVVLVEALDRILPHEDAEMAAALLAILQRRKVKVFYGATIESLAENGDGFSVRLSNGKEISPDTILQAVGRRFNTEGIGLEQLGIETERGRVLVDEHLQTNVLGHYVAGDVIGGWLLAHVAFAEGICAAEHALGMGSRMDYRVVPRCVFSIPEFASVGMSEEEARSQYPVKRGRFPFKSLGMAQAIGELEGMVKIISNAEKDQILGAQIIGAHGADLISEISIVADSRQGVPASLDAVYRLLCMGLLAGFRVFGFEAEIGRDKNRSPRADICFVHAAVGDIVYQGRKFVGSAQTWHGASLLQHGSILLEPQEMTWTAIIKTDSHDSLREKLKSRITSLREILGRSIDPGQLKRAIEIGMAEALKVELQAGELSPEEWALAGEIVSGKALLEETHGYSKRLPGMDPPVVLPGAI